MPPVPCDFLLTGASELLTMERGEGPAGIVRDGALAALKGRIVWVGTSAAAAASVELETGGRQLDASGQVVTPGLIDCHSHFVFVGDRAGEFAQRCAGESYLAIAQAGGGIRSTVEATRATSTEQLVELGVRRAGRLLLQGVTASEAKSGYGLSVAEELRLLTAIAEVARRTAVEIAPTLLGLHALPTGIARDRFVDEVAEELIPQAAERGLCRQFDAFMEEGAFTGAEVRRCFAAATRVGLGLRLHADQLSPGGGAELAAELGALSADHLEQVSDAGIAALAHAGTSAVLAPVASWVLRLKAYAPARRLIDAGVGVALATNFNPGSAPSENVALTIAHGCLSLGLSPAEALLGMTRHAARVLGLGDRLGRLAPGFDATLVLFGASDHRHLASHLGVNHAAAVIKQGALIAEPGGERCATPGARFPSA